MGISQRAPRLRARSLGPEELQVDMNLTLKIWRQQSAKAPGAFAVYQVQGVTPDMSFLEMLDLLNENLQAKGEPPVAFEHDWRVKQSNQGGGIKSVPGSMHQYCHKDAVPRVIDDPNDD